MHMGAACGALVRSAGVVERKAAAGPPRNAAAQRSSAVRPRRESCERVILRRSPRFASALSATGRYDQKAHEVLLDWFWSGHPCLATQYLPKEWQTTMLETQAVFLGHRLHSSFHQTAEQVDPRQASTLAYTTLQGSHVLWILTTPAPAWPMSFRRTRRGTLARSPHPGW